MVKLVAFEARHTRVAIDDNDFMVRDGAI